MREPGNLNHIMCFGPGESFKCLVFYSHLPPFRRWLSSLPAGKEQGSVSFKRVIVGGRVSTLGNSKQRSTQEKGEVKKPTGVIETRTLLMQVVQNNTVDAVGSQLQLHKSIEGGGGNVQLPIVSLVAPTAVPVPSSGPISPAVHAQAHAPDGQSVSLLPPSKQQPVATMARKRTRFADTKDESDEYSDGKQGSNSNSNSPPCSSGNSSEENQGKREGKHGKRKRRRLTPPISGLGMSLTSFAPSSLSPPCSTTSATSSTSSIFATFNPSGPGGPPTHLSPPRPPCNLGSCSSLCSSSTSSSSSRSSCSGYPGNSNVGGEGGTAPLRRSTRERKPVKRLVMHMKNRRRYKEEEYDEARQEHYFRTRVCDNDEIYQLELQEEKKDLEKMDGDDRDFDHKRAEEAEEDEEEDETSNCSVREGPIEEDVAELIETRIDADAEAEADEVEQTEYKELAMAYQREVEKEQAERKRRRETGLDSESEDDANEEDQDGQTSAEEEESSSSSEEEEDDDQDEDYDPDKDETGPRNGPRNGPRTGVSSETKQRPVSSARTVSSSSSGTGGGPRPGASADVATATKSAVIGTVTSFRPRQPSDGLSDGGSSGGSESENGSSGSSDGSEDDSNPSERKHTRRPERARGLRPAGSATNPCIAIAAHDLFSDPVPPTVPPSNMLSESKTGELKQEGALVVEAQVRAPNPTPAVVLDVLISQPQ